VYAANTLAEPTRVAPEENKSVRIEGCTLTLELPAVSWTALSLG
jgi:alpha-N-arabinofuranosidase